MVAKVPPKWAVVPLPDGQFIVQFRGRQLGSPKPTYDAAEAYLNRNNARYPGEGAALLVEANTAFTPRKGQYRLTLKDGSSEQVFASSKKMARELLLRERGKKKLPQGSTLQLVTAAT